MSLDERELNEVVLREMLRGLDKPTVISLVEYYIEETRARIPRLRPLLNAGKFTDLKREAHSLKGASRTYGASGYGEFAARLETASENQNHDDAEKWTGEIEARTENAIEALTTYLQAMPEK